MDSPELTAAKSDGAFLRRVLKIERDDQHALCPICNKKNMTVEPSKDGSDVYLWCCGSGCGAGTVVDALMAVEGKTIKEAMAEIRKEYSNGRALRHEYRKLPPAPVVEGVRYGKARPEPVLNKELAEKFITESHNYLLDNLDIVDRFERGISVDIIKRYRIGFIENAPAPWFTDGRQWGWHIPAGWVLPITDADGILKGVKLHFEIRPKSKGVPCEGKSRWVPFGTEPKFDAEKNIKPVHAFYTLWPHPSTLEDPKLAQEFSSDIHWWIQRIPDIGDLKHRWNRALEWAQYEVGQELGRAVEDLEPHSHEEAIERAYVDMREEIHRAVSKSTQKEKEEQIPDEEPIDWQDYIFICPGELKAMAILSTGLRAVSVTSGESWIPTPEILASFRGLHICIFYDSDGRRIDAKGNVHCPGKEWAKHLAAALARHGALSVVLLTGGRELDPSKTNDEKGDDQPVIEEDFA